MTRELGLCHHHSSSRGLVLPLLSSPYNHFQAFQSSTVVTGWEASERSGPDQTTGDDDRRRKEPNLRRELTERQLMTRSNSFLGQSLPVPSLVSLPYRYFFNLRIIDINLLPLVTVSSVTSCLRFPRIIPIPFHYLRSGRPKAGPYGTEPDRG